MEALFGLLVFISILCLIIGLIKPSLFSKPFKGVVQPRWKLGLIFVASTIICAGLAAAFEPNTPAKIATTNPTPRPPASSPTLQSATTTPQEATRCLNVSSELAKSIEEGSNTADITLKNIKAVKSNSESWYFVSAELQGPGLEGDSDIATFATDKLENGLILSVDKVADEFYDWPLASSTKFNLSLSSEGANVSRKCVNP